MSAESPDGSWVFEDGVLRSADAVVSPFAIDWFERWTFARFLPSGELALAFESGQPFDYEFGSYGDRRWGVQVLAPRPGQSVEPAAPPPLERWWPEVPWETAEQHPVESTLVD